MPPKQPAPPEPQGETAAPAKGKWKLMLLAAGFVAAIIVVYFTPLRSLLDHTREVSARLQAMGWVGPVVFVALTGALVAIGFPRLAMCFIGGLAFGFWKGLLWAQIGTIIGSYGTFVFVRWAGQEFMLRHWPGLQKYERMFVRGGIWTVVLAKQVPINGLWMNAILGLTRLKHSEYLAGMMIGIFPEAIPATLIGAGILQESRGKSIALIGIAILFFGVALFALRHMARRGKEASASTDGALPVTDMEKKP